MNEATQAPCCWAQCSSLQEECGCYTLACPTHVSSQTSKFNESCLCCYLFLFQPMWKQLHSPLGFEMQRREKRSREFVWFTCSKGNVQPNIGFYLYSLFDGPAALFAAHPWELKMSHFIYVRRKVSIPHTMSAIQVVLEEMAALGTSSVLTLSSLWDTAAWTVDYVEAVWKWLEIRFYRVEGRSANVFFPGTPLCLNCRWNRCILTMDSGTLRMWRCSICCWTGTCGSLVWFVWFMDCKGAMKARNGFLLWHFFFGSSCWMLAAARVRMQEGT